ncbi:flagellar hook-length control protein FliK [Exiguobacterium undae]
MNLMDIQQTQSLKANTKINGKDVLGNGGDFAALLQYLVQPKTDLSQGAVLPDSGILSTGENQVDVKPIVEQLMAQPEKILQLLDQPEIEKLTDDPKKAMEVIQFIKIIQAGQVEQAVDAFQQLPTTVQQTIVTSIASVLGVPKENLLSAGNTSTAVISAAKVIAEKTATSDPSDATKLISQKTLAGSFNTARTETVGTVARPESGTDLKKNLELFKGPSESEGKELVAALNGLKLNRLNSAMPVLSRASNPTSGVDEQLANRIEAALKQAPFLKGADGSTRMSIRLYPEQLGEVVVQLDRKEGVLTVKLFAATEQARQLIDQQLGKLHTSLQPQAPFVKIETGMLAASLKEFDQGLPQERQERQQEEPVPHEEEPEEDEDD